jgi:hypothetical protein
MSMEPLGGNLPAGGPVAVFANGRTHVFAIDAGGNMLHWNSANGITWTGPAPLPFGGLPVSHPAALALSNGRVHVMASGDYTLITQPLQGNWRRCGNCQSLWFGGARGPGACSASAKGHDRGTNEYFTATG